MEGIGRPRSVRSTRFSLAMALKQPAVVLVLEYLVVQAVVQNRGQPLVHEAELAIRPVVLPSYHDLAQCWLVVQGGPQVALDAFIVGCSGDFISEWGPDTTRLHDHKFTVRAIPLRHQEVENVSKFCSSVSYTIDLLLYPHGQPGDMEGAGPLMVPVHNMAIFPAVDIELVQHTDVLTGEVSEDQRHVIRLRDHLDATSTFTLGGDGRRAPRPEGGQEVQTIQFLTLVT